MITRRFFVFGTAAVVATVTADAHVVERVAVPSRLYPRSLYEMCLGSTGATEPAEVWVRRYGDDRPILHMGVGPHGCARWISHGRLNDVLDVVDVPLAVEVLGGDTDRWTVQLFFRGRERVLWLFEGRERRYVETHRFPERSVSRMYLEP